jgi:type 1 glutamine amidotransferase
VAVRGTHPEVLHTVDDFDLLVVNSGRADDGSGDRPPDDVPAQVWAAAHEALYRAVAGGTAVLGLHQAANSFAESPFWKVILGGRWVPGTSMHPPYGDAVLDVAGPHPIVAGLSRLDTVDERYSYLEVSPDSQVLLTHRHQDVDHPVVWVHARPPYRVVYDALGHDVAAHRTRGRQVLLDREVDWLLAGGR